MVYSDADTESDTDTDNNTDAETDADADEILNTDWIEQLKDAENVYNDFYKEPVTSIKVFFLYVNTANELEHIYSDVCLLNAEGVISGNNIVSLIKHNQYFHSVKYKLMSLLKYNIDLEPHEVPYYISDAADDVSDDLAAADKNTTRFFTTERYLGGDIRFVDSINMFQDLNALFFIFTEPVKKPVALSAGTSSSQTKKVYLSSVNRTSATRNGKTKKYKRHNDNLKKNLKINKAI
jgi:hypothetical protein